MAGAAMGDWRLIGCQEESWISYNFPHDFSALVLYYLVVYLPPQFTPAAKAPLFSALLVQQALHNLTAGQHAFN